MVLTDSDWLIVAILLAGTIWLNLESIRKEFEPKKGRPTQSSNGQRS